MSDISGVKKTLSSVKPISSAFFDNQNVRSGQELVCSNIEKSFPGTLEKQWTELGRNVKVCNL